MEITLTNVIICSIVAYSIFSLGHRTGKIEIARKMKNILESSQVNIEIERHGDKLYVYDSITKEFIIQGDTYSDIVKSLQEIHPTKTFITSQTNIDEISGS